MLTQQRLHELLSYDPDTGAFVWIGSTNNKVPNGTIAGTVRNGYVRIRLDGKNQAAHRLAWLYVYGELPPSNIDHVNRNRADNRIINLRLATQSENVRNSGMRSDNASGYRGVHWNVRRQRWCATVNAKGHYKWLGSFKCPKEAAAAYDAATVELYGDFAPKAPASSVPTP